MATNPNEAPKNSAPTHGYETRDASVPWVFAIVGALAVTGLFIHFVVAGYVSALRQKPAPTDQWQPGVRPGAGPLPLPAYPKLQVSPPLDLAEFRAREEELLNSYGWINPTSNTVRIPIARAMELTLKRGLPVRRPETNESGMSSYQFQLRRVEQLPQPKKAQ